MDAKLVGVIDGSSGVELRKATRRSQTWSGYDESCPLGRTGYWLGTHGSHRLLSYGESQEVLARPDLAKVRP